MIKTDPQLDAVASGTNGQRDGSPQLSRTRMSIGRREPSHVIAITSAFSTNLKERAEFREREKMRSSYTVVLWKDLRHCLRAKVSAFNAQWGGEFIKSEMKRDKLSISLPPSTPWPPYDLQPEAVQVSLKHNRKLLLFHLVHSDYPGSPVWALRTAS